VLVKNICVILKEGFGKTNY